MFPEFLKHAEEFPIYKSDTNKTTVNNYIPISCFSKFFGLNFERLKHFLYLNGVQHCKQSRFRKNGTIEPAVNQIVNS